MRFITLVIACFFLLNACNENSTSTESASSETSSNTSQRASTSTAVKDLSPIELLLANSSKPAVIKFHAVWCSTCKNYAPKFAEVENELGDKADFISIDVDDKEYKPLLKQLKISRIPETAFVSRNRKNITKKLGSISPRKLKKLIESSLFADDDA